MERIYNQYTRPLEGEPDRVYEGYLKFVFKEKKYTICKIRYEVFWNMEYQYVFEPMHEKIDTLRNLGICNPFVLGLNLDLRYDKYYRVNMLPTLIYEGSPPKSRPFCMDMMKEVGLYEYNAFEYMVRSKARFNTFLVERGDEDDFSRPQ